MINQSIQEQTDAIEDQGHILHSIKESIYDMTLTIKEGLYNIVITIKDAVKVILDNIQDIV